MTGFRVAAAPRDGAAARPPWGESLALLSSVLLGGWLLFAAIAKMLSPRAFVVAVDSYGVLPGSYALLAATGLVAAETALGFLLLTGILRRRAAWLNLPLLLVFAAMVGWAVKTGRTADCGCYGEVLSLPPRVELFVDLGLLLLNGLVLWRGRDVAWVPAGWRQGLAWASLTAGGALFLAGGPAPPPDAALDVGVEDLAVLQAAEPPLDIPREGLLFLFGADCHDCWSFAGAVQLIADRLEGLPVQAVTFSDPQALEEFERAFSPTYPIHRVAESQFHDVTTTIPAAIWLRDGRVEEAWSGRVPSHRELAELGGYRIRKGAGIKRPAVATPPAASAQESTAQQLFGGPVRARH